MDDTPKPKPSRHCAHRLHRDADLTKAELSELLYERLGLNKREAKDMVEAFFELSSDSLIRGP